MFNEGELISRILSGELKVFEGLVNQYQKLVYSILYKFVTESDVEDVSQEVFIKIYKNLKHFKSQSKLSTWIAKIAYTTALNHIKKSTRVLNYSGNIEQFDGFHFDTDNPEMITIKKDISIYINNLIRQLPVPLRTVLILYHQNEFSYKEIQTITGFPEGTVKVYLFRARKLLKDKIIKQSKNEIYG